MKGYNKSVRIHKMFDLLTALYRNYPQVLVIWGKDWNKFPEDHLPKVRDEDCIVVCDNPHLEYTGDKSTFRIDGAYSIEMVKGAPQYQWWPYPEKPLRGKVDILNHIKKNHLPEQPGYFKLHKKKKREPKAKKATNTETPKQPDNN